MHDEHKPKSSAEASLSRRTFISLTATGAAMTLPAAALSNAAGHPAELPIEVFERHAYAVAGALNDYLDGKFCVTIYPSDDREDPLWLTKIEPAEPVAAPIDQQLDACVSRLKGILAQMHPEAAVCRHGLSVSGKSYLFFIAGDNPDDLANAGRATLGRLREDRA